VQGTGDKAQAKKISIKKAQATRFTVKGTGDMDLIKFSVDQGTWILLEITLYYVNSQSF
jgi:hypothetical protein